MLNIYQSLADKGFLLKMANAVAASKCKESPFEVMAKGMFDQMSSEDLQSLFKLKHIVIKGIPHAKRAFDRRSLEMLGSWEQPRTFQGVSFTSMHNVDAFTGVRFVQGA
jgi:hypothetical protein